MKSRFLLLGSIVAATVVIAGCDENRSGPVRISAVGGIPARINPNLEKLDTASATLLLATAQGLVRFDAAGQIEPALAQSWIVSDDGLRYTFRLDQLDWEDGSRVTAQQVVERLRAAASAGSRNPLKPLLGAIDEIQAMTDDVLEISLVSARPNFLQLLAQPEMAILRNGVGTGPYAMGAARGGVVPLTLRTEDEDAENGPATRNILLRGESAARAIVGFKADQSDLVLGGTAGTLPIVQASNPARLTLRFDPAIGLMGLAFGEGPLASSPQLRRALSMAIDRDGLVAAFNVPDLLGRTTILPSGITELPVPILPDWAARPLPARRAEARQQVEQTMDGDGSLIIQVALPDEPGYRLLFAHLHRDWKAIGVEARRVAETATDADLRLVDRVGRIDLATWYLRQFTCEESIVCDPEADRLLAEAREARTAEQRQSLLAQVERRFTEESVFIPLTNPVRWSLVAPRLTGFTPNTFAIHNLSELIAPPR